MTPDATNWTNPVAVGAQLKCGYGGFTYSNVSAGVAGSGATGSSPSNISAATTNYTSNPQWIKSVSFAAAGYKDLSKDPAAAANSWYSKNQDALTKNGLDKYKVGPWFAYLEVVLGKNGHFSSANVTRNGGVYAAPGCQTTTSSNLYYAPGRIPEATTESCPALNSWGDYWSVSVKNTTSGALAQPDTIVHGANVTKAAVTTSGSYAAQTSAVKTAFFANSIPSTASDLKDLAASKLAGSANGTSLTYTSGSMGASTTATLGTAMTLQAETLCD